ncbi:LAFA_0G15434g1_1 [Lachancea sp. 'fantastica']|nr:LAFA_0G15434g1_1 [Lachancea sp. 'fantastica']
MARIFGVGVASALAIVQFAALAFLIICCVTAPVFKQIGIAKTSDVVFGTFGYCEKGVCSSAAANYHPETIDTSETWKMSTSVRRKLGRILIIMPVAAGLTFFAMVGTIVSQIGSLSASGVCLVFNVLLNVIAFAASALMCIVTFLLFFPSITWCAWLLIPAAAINLLCVPLAFVAHSLGSADDAERDFDSTNSPNLTRLDQDDAPDRYSLDDYKESAKFGNHDNALYREVYKGPQIVSSTTINSGTTDSRSDRDAFIREGPNNNTGRNASHTQLASAEPVPDFSFEDTSNVAKPYSAIAASHNLQGMPQEDLASKPIRAPQMLRGPSTTSSFYSQTDGELSRQGTLRTTDLRPTSALDLQSAKGVKTGHDELQNIINGAIHEEEDEEFLKQQTIDPSERPSLDDDDGIKDDDSDFTSVSQRGINPNYMSAISGNRFAQRPVQPAVQHSREPRITEDPSFAKMPNHKYQVVPSQAQRKFAPPPQGMVPQHHYQPYNPQQPVQPSGRIPNYGRPQRVPQVASGGSDAILNTSPDFIVPGVRGPQGAGGRVAQRPMYAAPQQAAPATMYKPAYKKRLPRQNIPAASMARDGPYSGMM